MVLPDLPVMLESIGGKEFKWLIIPSFAIIALLTRPFSGKLADTVGRVFVMMLGAIITMLACGLYIFIPIVSLFFINRAFHGFCAGFTPTGFTAYADDIVPLEKRGEAMGIIGICNNIGNAIGWVIGSKCTEVLGLNSMFAIASGLGLIAVLIFATLPETVKNKHAFSLSLLKLNRNELFEWRVLLPGLVMLLTAFTSGAILAIIADFTAFVGISNKGLYMAIYILSSLFIRFMAGRWSDKFGRKLIALLGSIALFASMLTLAYATDIVLYTISSVLFGVGFGLVSPSLFAWAVDLSLPGLKGKAVGTLFIFLEIGIILGSSIAGLIYNSDSNNFFMALVISAMVTFVPVILLYRAMRLETKMKRLKRRHF